ncbi:MAG: hypothetical protein LUC60_06805 [Lachnospiraceae bacterium]|nr:hypothetical protein [Lachnospiraceae bacterium]
MKRLLILLAAVVLLTGCGLSDITEYTQRLPGNATQTEETQERRGSDQSGTDETEISAKEPEAESETTETALEASEDSSPEMEAIAASILSSDMSEYETVKAIHDYLVYNVDYDYDNLNANTLPETAYTAEGALLLHSAVCEGYARAFSYLCEQAGLESLMVYGSANDGATVLSHAWNQVRVNNAWFNVDVTWDDPLVNGELVTDGSNIIYDYFLVPDSSLEETHTAEGPDDRHICSDTRYLESNRLLSIEPYLEEPYCFVSSDEEIVSAVQTYLSGGTYQFQIICDATAEQAEAKMNLVLDAVTDAMQKLQLSGQIAAGVEYGVADYAVITVTITPS